MRAENTIKEVREKSVTCQVSTQNWRHCFNPAFTRLPKSQSPKYTGLHKPTQSRWMRNTWRLKLKGALATKNPQMRFDEKAKAIKFDTPNKENLALLGTNFGMAYGLKSTRRATILLATLTNILAWVEQKANQIDSIARSFVADNYTKFVFNFAPSRPFSCFTLTNRKQGERRKATRETWWMMCAEPARP